MVRSEQSTNYIKKSSTHKNNIQKEFFERQILQTTVPKHIVIVLCVIKPAGKITKGTSINDCRRF